VAGEQIVDNSDMQAALSAQPTPSDTENPGGFAHIPSLDGVRGTAILLVLFCHLFSSNLNTGSRFFNFLNALRESSYIGVNLFFVLSGFLISGVLFDTLNQPHFFKTFYARRALRIFPLYYGFLILLLLLTSPLHLDWSGLQYFYLSYTANFAFGKAETLDLHPFNINHFWSLHVEEQFYLVWPILVFRIRRIPTLIRLCLITCAASLVFRIVAVVLRPHYQALHLPYWTPFSTTFSCVDNLLFGCSLCAVLRTPFRQRILVLAPRVFLICSSTLVLVGCFYRGLLWQHTFFIPTFGFTLVALAFTALIAMALSPGSQTERFFTNRILRFFGKYSYGIYVFHYSIHEILTRPTRLYIDNHLHSKVFAIVGGAAVVMAATIPLAVLSYHLYEAPFLRLKRYFSYNQQASAPSTIHAT
jgi:peptidoglycan/LPS O-acetylase OafA/YrhL